MRTFVIGDIHGMYPQLTDLMYEINEKGFHSRTDRLVFVGDYVDGGPYSKKVITQLIMYKKCFPHWVFLRGNHEDMMLDALIGRSKKYKDFYQWWNQGGRKTIDSYKEDFGKDLTDYDKALLKPIDVVDPEHLDFLRNLPLYFEDENGFYVHAGVPPELSIEEFKKKLDSGDSQAVEEALWIRHRFFLENKDWGKTIVYGHTPEDEPQVKEWTIGIDTMTRNGGKLTAVELPAREFYFTERVGQWW